MAEPTAPDPAAGMLLRADKLSKYFGSVCALNGFSCTIGEREIVAVVGPNGSGKTTFFDLVSRHLKETSGALLFDGGTQSLTRRKAREVIRAGIARTFQESRLFWHMTVLDNVLIGANCHIPGGLLADILWCRSGRLRHKQAVESARRCLEVFGDRLLPRENELAHGLSYANRRRLEIARALASKPRLLMLDEPVAGMNPTEADELMEILLEIRNKGIALCFIEHNMDTVRTIADRVIVLAEGRKIADGTFGEIVEAEEVKEAYLGYRPSAT